MVEVVLPKEYFCLLCVFGETYVASQTISINLDIASIDTLQRHLPLSSVHYLELRQLAFVVGSCVVQYAVRVAAGRSARGFVDDAEGLSVWDIFAPVRVRLFYGEVVEFRISTILVFCVEGKQGMA